MLQDIFKAFAVLSLESSKIEYDQPKGKELTPDNYRSIEQLEDKVLAKNILSYREQTKKRYNINKLGRYNGGIPNPDGMTRGDALDVPGAFHDVEMQRFYEQSDFVADFNVNRQDVVEYGRYMLDDRLQYGISRTWLRAKIDEKYFSPKQYSVTWTIFFVILALNATLVWTNFLSKGVTLSVKHDQNAFQVTKSGILRLN
jgi:hypothetical protein